MRREKTIWFDHQAPEDWREEIPEFSMYSFIAEAAGKWPEHYALWLEGRRVRYRELMEHIDAAAKGFLASGVQKGDVVTLISPNLPQAVYAFYALNRVGAAANILHPLLSPREMKRHILRTGSQIVVVLDQFYEKLCAVSWEDGSAPRCIVFRASEALPFPKNLLYRMREKKPVGPLEILLWDDFLSAGAGRVLPEDEGAGDDTAAILYSGGTSGEAKGVLLTNRNFNALAIQSYDTMGIHDVSGLQVLDILPIFHGTGLGVCIHSMLVNGFQIYLIPNFNGEKCTKLIFRERIEFLFGVPAFYEVLSRSREIDTKDCSFLTVMGSCGDRLPDKVRSRMDAYLKRSGAPGTLTNGYGMTECTAGCCYEPFFLKKPGSSGMMVPDMKAKIVKPGTQRELPVGEIGELCIAGPTVMKGYFQEPEATAKTLQTHEDGTVWLHTGDAFSIDEDGYLYFHQRLDRMFIVSGFNIYPGQIEQAIQEIPCVQQCCAVGQEAPVAGKNIVVYVLFDNSVSEEEAARLIRARCKEELPEYSQPGKIVFLKEFPKTRMGKVDYRALEHRQGGKNHE